MRDFGVRVIFEQESLDTADTDSEFMISIIESLCFSKRPKLLGSKVIRNLPLFFGGNIASDAIHAKPNYTREDKRCTHLTEGILIDQFQNPEKLNIFGELKR